MLVNQKFENDFVKLRLGSKKRFYKIGSIRIFKYVGFYYLGPV